MLKWVSKFSSSVSAGMKEFYPLWVLSTILNFFKKSQNLKRIMQYYYLTKQMVTMVAQEPRSLGFRRNCSPSLVIKQEALFCYWMCTVSHPKAQWLKSTHTHSFSFESGIQEWRGWAFWLRVPHELQSSSSLPLMGRPSRSSPHDHPTGLPLQRTGAPPGEQCSTVHRTGPVRSQPPRSDFRHFCHKGVRATSSVRAARGCEQWRLPTQDWSWLSNTHWKGLFLCPSGFSQKGTAQVTLWAYFPKLQHHLSFFQNQGARQTCFKNNREGEWEANTIEEAPLESSPRETAFANYYQEGSEPQQCVPVPWFNVILPTALINKKRTQADCIS